MQHSMVIESGDLRVRFWQEEGKLRHAVDVRSGTRWQPFLLSGGPENTEGTIRQLDFLELAQPPTENSLSFQAHLEDVAVGLQVRAPEEDVLYFSADLRLRRPADFTHFCQTYEVAWPDLDDVWAPYLAPQPGDLIGQQVFRAPGVSFQAGALAFCLIPDLDLLETTWTKMPVAIELDADRRVHERPLLAYGCINYNVRNGGFFAATDHPRTFVFRDTLGIGWYIVLDSNCPPGTAWRPVLRFCWRKWGNEAACQLRPQIVPWQRYAERITPQARLFLWTNVPSRGERCGAIITGRRTSRFDTRPNSVLFTARAN
ncbi:MAG: hypothetical protein H5T86_15605, partial [Armatimonadetes bacterium]|nr:hypothetical protein [Armatimonadota bacterium]